MLKLLLHSPLLAILLGPIVTFLGDQGQKLITFYDALPPIGKQGAAVVLSFALVALAHLLPGTVPDACANVAANGIGDACIAGLTSKEFLTGVLTALVAVAVKHGQQNAGK